MSTTRRVKLVYPAHLVNLPLLYEMIKRFDIVTNVHAADTTADEGWLLAEVSGEPGQLDAALAWVQAQGVRVEDA